MGAPPKVVPSPARVAQSFVNVYYSVAQKMPQRIVQLYGPDSEIHHGEGLSANGPAIAHIACKLPLAGAVTTVHNVAAQQTGDSAYLVVVLGRFVTDGRSQPFTQTFVLQKQRDSHDVHFYCRNDIFATLSATTTTTTAAAAAAAAAAATATTTAAAPTATDTVTATAATATAATATAATAVTNPPDISPSDAMPAVPVEPANTPPPTDLVSHKPASPQPADAQPEPPAESPADEPHLAQVTPHPLPPVNGTVPAHKESEPQPHTSPESVIPPVDPASPTPPSAAPAQPDHTPDHRPAPQLPKPDSPEPATATRSAPSPKKTWASIVSSKDQVEASLSPPPSDHKPPLAPTPPEQPAESVPPQSDHNTSPHTTSTSTTTTTTPSTATSTPATSITTTPTPTITTTTTPTTTVTSSTTNSNISAASTAATRRDNFQNGHRHQYHHPHPYRSHPRVFGPSAVVQLAILGDQPVQDPRGLTNSLREEFSTYGHKLCHVEVKAAKGIAFVEYDTPEGVKAAVAAWANGPRNEGPFKGIPLNVSEKRPPYAGRRPGGMRGGRGGARGARRHRPTSTPLS